MKINLLICPICEQKGRKEVLGEIDDQGRIIIMRFHKGTTRIISKELSIECGACGEKVYERIDTTITSFGTAVIT